jgi:hypothetical protein
MASSSSAIAEITAGNAMRIFISPTPTPICGNSIGTAH